METIVEHVMKIVTTNQDPTIDEAASTYAYAELLKKKDQKAVGAKFGEINEDTQELLEQLNAELSDASYYLYSADEAIIVSAGSMDNISTRINPDKVTTIIDNEDIDTDQFPEAEALIEEDMHTASAIIAEKFMEEGIEISNESAQLLHQAAASVKEDDANEKELEIISWLKDKMQKE